MTLWMGQDGFDPSFQMDHARARDDTVAAIAEVCDHALEVDITIESKPNAPRAYALMPQVGTTLLAIKEVGRANLAVTLDFAHVFHADEMPAHAAALIVRHSRLLGLHLNHGYGRRDDGLMAGTVHPVQMVQLLVEMLRQGHDGVIYFDIFPDLGGLDPVEEARANIRLLERLRAVAAARAGAGIVVELERAGVDTGQVQRGDGASGMSVALVVEGDGDGAVIVSAANRKITAGRIAIPDGCRILPIRNEVPAAINLDVARRARAAGAEVVLNAAPALAVDPALLALVDVLVVNRVEGADLLGIEAGGMSPVEMVGRLLDICPRADVVLTRGGDGAAFAPGRRDRRAEVCGTGAGPLHPWGRGCVPLRGPCGATAGRGSGRSGPVRSGGGGPGGLRQVRWVRTHLTHRRTSCSITRPPRYRRRMPPA